MKYYIIEYDLNEKNPRKKYYTTVFDKPFICIEEVWENVTEENCEGLSIPIKTNTFFIDFED